MINILIIEDERFAQEKLRGLITEHLPQGNVIKAITSIKESLDYLTNFPHPDLIFMDVELSDGLCFEIFKQIEIESQIIITTAYDQYAINAFQVGSIDYLLKPIDPSEFKKSISRFTKSQVTNNSEQPNYLELIKILNERNEPKKRFTVRIGDRILIIEATNIAYFVSEEKFTYIVTTDGHKYITDMTLDNVEELVDSRRFFRLSRGCIASIESIKSITKHLNGRLKIDLIPSGLISESPVVSRQRFPEFMKWLEG